MKATQDRDRFCRICYKNVPGLDHHCMWLNTCIGRRNYWAFFSLALLGTAQHLLGIALALSTTTAWRPSNAPVTGVAVFAAVVAAMSIGAVAAFGSLLAFHVHLVRVGLGTYDWLVHRADTRLASERAANDAEAEERWQREQQAMAAAAATAAGPSASPSLSGAAAAVAQGSQVQVVINEAAASSTPGPDANGTSQGPPLDSSAVRGTPVPAAAADVPPVFVSPKAGAEHTARPVPRLPSSAENKEDYAHAAQESEGKAASVEEGKGGQ